MVLQTNRLFFVEVIILRRLNKRGFAFDLEVVLNQNAVLENGYVTGLDQFFAVKNRTHENDVVRLPFARLAASVDSRRILLVNSAALTVIVGLVDVAVQNLDFVRTIENAAVAASLTFAFNFRRRSEFNVKLNRAENLFRRNHASARINGAVDNLPVFAVVPSGHIFTVKQNNRVRGNVSWSGRFGSRIDYRRFFPLNSTFPFLSVNADSHHTGANRRDYKQGFLHNNFLLLRGKIKSAGSASRARSLRHL